MRAPRGEGGAHGWLLGALGAALAALPATPRLDGAAGGAAAALLAALLGLLLRLLLAAGRAPDARVCGLLGGGGARRADGADDVSGYLHVPPRVGEEYQAAVPPLSAPGPTAGGSCRHRTWSSLTA